MGKSVSERLNDVILVGGVTVSMAAFLGAMWDRGMEDRDWGQRRVEKQKDETREDVRNIVQNNPKVPSTDSR